MTMSEKMLETLSAAIDNEAGQFELRRLLDEAGRNRELRAAWMRYHAIGAVLRGEWQAGGGGLGERVCRAPQTESAPGAGGGARQAARKPWRAAAASLAAVAALAVLLATIPAGGPGGEPGGRTAARPLSGTSGHPAQPGPAAPAERERLHAYMMRHLQHRAMHHPGVSSFTKCITYGAAELPWQ